MIIYLPTAIVTLRIPFNASYIQMFLTTFLLYTMQLCGTDTAVTRRNLSYRNRQRFYESISSVNWEAIYSESDTQTAFGLFHSTLLKHFYKNFPKQTVKIRYNNRKPWLTQGLKDSIRMKNKLYRKYLKVKSVANEMNYRSYRTKLNHKVAEKQHYSELLNNCQDNIKKSWQIIKGIVNRNKSNQLQTKFKLNNGSFTTDGYVISNKLSGSKYSKAKSLTTWFYEPTIIKQYISVRSDIWRN